MARWRYAILIVVMVIAGCSDMNIDSYKDTSPTFRPEEFFNGETRAWGFFQDRFGNIRREFKVTTRGQVEGDTLTLIEEFAYGDGASDTRTWTLKQTGPNTFTGTAGDVIGEASVVVEGRAMRMEYDLDLKMNDRTMQVHFVDLMLLQPDGILLNKSKVSKFGITIGEVVIYFQRVEDGSELSSRDDLGAVAAE